MNDRCGVAADFSTPEYTKFATVHQRPSSHLIVLADLPQAQAQKWETCEGIDPTSFGYNKNSDETKYRSSESIIHNLVDIVSSRSDHSERQSMELRADKRASGLEEWQLSAECRPHGRRRDHPSHGGQAARRGQMAQDQRRRHLRHGKYCRSGLYSLFVSRN